MSVAESQLSFIKVLSFSVPERIADGTLLQITFLSLVKIIRVGVPYDVCIANGNTLLQRRAFSITEVQLSGVKILCLSLPQSRAVGTLLRPALSIAEAQLSFVKILCLRIPEYVADRTFVLLYVLAFFQPFKLSALQVGLRRRKPR